MFDLASKDDGEKADQAEFFPRFKELPVVVLRLVVARDKLKCLTDK